MPSTLLVYKNEPMNKNTDVIVIGSGLAGLVAALKISEFAKVTLLNKTKLNITNSALAQGGIAAVMAEGDDFEKHINDTLQAGAGLCDEKIVRHVVEQAPERIQDLINWGVTFDLYDSDHYSLNKEGGHSKRRILHVADHTGSAIHQVVLAKALKNKNIRILENVMAVELIKDSKNQCRGTYALDKKTGQVDAYLAKATIIATGGAGKVYLYTSNWDGATGDGIAMAYRAGANVSNLEFMQFHPTCLYHHQDRNFLITEAMRGEGAILKNSKGEAFMDRYHKLSNLAPRDIVARSIDSEMKRLSRDFVHLDISHKPAEDIKKRFPSIYERCLNYGIDITKEPIPVVPAAHYLCGGIVTDVHARTDIENLYAVGESACTGLHGANRLASNSLLECTVFSNNCAEDLKAKLPSIGQDDFQPEKWPEQVPIEADELVVASHMWDEIRRLVWNYVGIVRSNKRLERAKHRLDNIEKEIQQFYDTANIQPDIIELKNISLVANLTVKSALARHESRGIHYNINFPFKEDLFDGQAQNTVLHR